MSTWFKSFRVKSGCIQLQTWQSKLSKQAVDSMRQAGLAAPHNTGDATMSGKELLLHSIKEEEEARSTARSSLAEARHNASGAESYPLSSHSTHYSNSDSRCDDLTDNADLKSAEPNVSEGGSEPGVLTNEDSGQVNPVDIGLKVANEIIGLHSQAAAAGRALAHSTRHVELMQEENTQLKDDLAKAQHAQRAMEEEIGRIKAKLSQRSIEMLMQEQKVQTAEERTAEQEACLAAAHERYDSLVMRLMVVVVKASVAAEELERRLQAGRCTAGSNCTCKPAMHHAYEVLSGLAAFRDTLLQGSVPPEHLNFSHSRAPIEPSSSQRPYSNPSPTNAAAAAPSASEQSSGGRGVVDHRDAIGTRLEIRRRRSSSSTSGSYPSSTGLPAATPPAHSRPQIKRPSSAGEVSRLVGMASAWAGDSSRNALTRSVEVPNLQLAALQQQLQQKQEEVRAARASMNAAGKRAAATRSRSITSSREVSPRRSTGAPGTDALSAAANMVYASILQQKKQLRASVSGRRAPTTPTVGAASARRTSTCSTQSKAPARRKSSTNTLNHPPWGAGRRRSSAAPSALTTPRFVGGYSEQDDPWSSAVHAVNALASNSYSNLMGAEYDSQYDSMYSSTDAVQLERSTARAVHSSKGSFTETAGYGRPVIALRPSSSSGWY